MTSSSDRPQEQYGVYRIEDNEASTGYIYYLSAGPYTERKQALHKAEELNKSEPEIYFSYVVSEYKGESWSPETASGT